MILNKHDVGWENVCIAKLVKNLKLYSVAIAPSSFVHRPGETHFDNNKVLATNCTYALEVFKDMKPAYPTFEDTQFYRQDTQGAPLPLAMAVRLHYGHQKELNELLEYRNEWPEACNPVHEHAVAALQLNSASGRVYSGTKPQGAHEGAHTAAFQDTLVAYTADHRVPWVPRAVACANAHRPLNGGVTSIPEGGTPEGGLQPIVYIWRCWFG